MENKKLIAVLLLLLASDFVLAQSESLPSITPPAPNAAALGKFVETPVNLYNGIPEIKIPIYEINLPDADVEISLSYHGGGVKVTEIPSWVGLGWALNAGGVITRSVHGNPDESSIGYPGGAAVPETNCLVGDYAYLFCYDKAILNLTDYEPDIFYYNFSGYTGKFVVNRTTQNVSSIPYNNLKIEPLNSDFNSWKITTENGTEFFFDAMERSVTTGSSTGSSYGSSWYLTKIISAKTGEEITLEYDIENYSYRLPVSQTKYIPFQTNYLCLPTKQNGVISNISHMVITDGRRLKKIVHPKGIVEFVGGNFRYDLSGSKSLKEIKIYNKTDFLKSFEFNYSYSKQGPELEDDPGGATETTIEDTGRRLFLKSIEEKSGESIKKPYRFKYYRPSNAYQYNFLPDRLTSFAQDHWGYYNGQVANTSLIPFFKKSVSGDLVDGALRHVVKEYAKIGTLNRIDYPTGGSVEFEFELNQALHSKLPKNITTFTASYGIGSCHTATGSNLFTISGNSPLTKVNLRLYGGPYPFVALNCNGNTSIPTAGNQNSWIWFQILNVTDAANPFIAYTSTAQVTLGNSHSGQSSINLPNGTYRIKAVRGMNLTINAPELTDTYANINGMFYFEASGYYETNTNLVGGLRIKKISYSDALNTDKINTYDYTENGITSGKVSFIPVFNYQINDAISCNIGTASEIVYNHEVQQYDVITSYSNSPLSSMSASHVGYGKVTVFEGEKDSSNSVINGKTEFYFTNSVDMYAYLPNNLENVCYLNTFTNDGFQFPFAPSISKDWKRGNLTKKVEYKYENNQYIPLKETRNFYKDDYLGSEFYYNSFTDVKGMKIGVYSTPLGYSPMKYIFSKQYYFIPSRYSKLIRTENYEYKCYGPYCNSELLLQEDYVYDEGEHLQLIRKEKLNSKGDKEITRYFYPSDKKTIAPYDAMFNRHIWSPVIEEITYKDSVDNVNILTATKTEYSLWQNGLILPIRTSTMHGQGNFESRILYGGYDIKGNILSVSKYNGPKIGYKWGYDNQYPIVEVKNANIESVAYEDFEGNGLIGATVGAVSRTGKGGFSGTINLSLFYSHLIGNSKLRYYQYNGGRWELIESDFTGQLLIGLIDDITIYPKDSQMTTYTYKPLVGMTSMTDASGRTTYYEYDGFQRLKSVKDEQGNIVKNYDYHYQTP